MKTELATEIVSCPVCLRPKLPETVTVSSQWVSYCKCDSVYSPGSNFSIDVCSNCNLRVPAGTSHKVDCKGVCACATPSPKKVPSYIKQNENDSASLDLTLVGMSPETFPSERYKPLAILGDGTRATTVLARDKQRGTKVAVKCYKQLPPNMRPTFESELRKNKELNHASIGKITDSGFYNNKTPYVVTEYKDGFNLEQCLAIHGLPSYDVAIKILIGICEALVYGQKQGVLHQNLKAANVIFLDDGNADPSIAVLDFALPKTQESIPVTDPYDVWYLSGDSARNLDYNERAELYPIGCIGFALNTGRAPFVEGTVREITNNHALVLPPRMDNLHFDKDRPKPFQDIIENCLEKDPRYRADSVAKLQERLEVFPRAVQLRKEQYLAAKKLRRTILAAVAGIGSLAVIAIIFAILQHH